MIILVVNFCLILIAIAMLFTIMRLIKGPDIPDRVLALDTLYINAIAFLILLGIKVNSEFYFESALLIAIIGFIGTVVVSKYMLRGDIIE